MTTSNSVNKFTTGLAGAVALAGGSQAYGAVVAVSTPANIIPTSGVTAATFRTWDVNNDGTLDFQFGFQQTSTTGNFLGGVAGYGANLPVAYQGPYVVYANRLSLGNTVGASSVFTDSYPYFTVLGSRFSGTFYGQFTSATGAPLRGYMGFRFTAADGVHYGAIELQTSPFASAANPGGLSFFSAEYQTTPGVALTIATVAVPEPSSLAMLAFGGAGAVGAVAMRRRRRQAAAQA